ncbi:MAG TPA: Na/Pi cotransporter family protein [Bryobacteraceae bacterium]|nr:Na/Pi cotransporter family protein [Bryobacteraceae bacterium]
MFILLTILGGVALIQFGVRTLRKGTDRLFGSQIGPVLQNIARYPGRTVFSGLGISLLVPSSTGLSSLAVQTVQSGYVLPRQMLGILLGADVGLTVISQLLALHVEACAPLLLLAGVFLYQYTTATKSRGVGQILLSFGLLFLGIGIIQSAAAAFDPHGDIVQLLEIAGHNPIRMAILAAILAVVFQSSTATVGLFIGLAGSSTVALPTPVMVAGVVGANVGVALTTLFLGWGQISSRRMAVANLMAKGLTAALMLILLPWAARLLEHSPGTIARHVANVHTGFNVLKALIVLPLVGSLSKLADLIVPLPPAGQKEVFGPRYISDGPIEGGSLALGQSLREVLRVSEIVRAMCNDWWRAFENNMELLAREVAARDDHIDLLDREIQKFLSRVGAENLDTDQAAEQMRQLRFLSELETVGDVIERNLCELVSKKIKTATTFSKESWRKLEVFQRLVAENMIIAETAFNTRDPVLAQKLLRHKDAVNRCADELRDEHFRRLNRELVESHETTAIYLESIGNLRRINSHYSHVAYAILQNDKPPSPFRELLLKADEISGSQTLKHLGVTE